MTMRATHEGQDREGWWPQAGGGGPLPQKWGVSRVRGVHGAGRNEVGEAHSHGGRDQS